MKRGVSDGNFRGNSTKSPATIVELPSRRKTLTDLHIKQHGHPKAKPWKMHDADGLFLLIHPNGAKYWRLDYRYRGKRNTISLGVYPGTTLAQARAQTADARKLLSLDKNPSRLRWDAKRLGVYTESQTLRVVGEEWHARHSKDLAPLTIEKNAYLLRVYIYPGLGKLPIGTIEPPDVLRLLQTIEERGRRETAHRVKTVIGQICRYAIVTGRAKRDPTLDLKGALLSVTKTHFPAVTTPKAVGALLRAIDTLAGSTSSVALALRLAPYVFVRPGELRTAEWSEINLQTAQWMIPAAKMKMRADHLVPLSRQAVAILKEAKARPLKRKYVFPAVRDTSRPIGEMAINAALRSLGYGTDTMVAHGFRAMARTLLDEQLRVPPDIIEAQLAHAKRGSLGSTYNRAAFLEQRTAMMTAYADYLDSLQAPTR